MAEPKRGDSRAGDRLVGYAALGCIAVGVASAPAAIAAWSDNDWQGGGLCLIAAGIAFGSLLHAVGR